MSRLLGRTLPRSYQLKPGLGHAVASPAAGTLIIALAATLLMAPELAAGLTVTDNFRFNLIWPEQFAELFRSGHPYPRWLPRSWDGLGSPVFYFYPPLFFWICSLLDTLTFGALPPEKFVPLASLFLLAASGFAMRAWLRAHTSEARALAGAILYVSAPYHLYDLYGRGALAEASAYASVPLIMLALVRLERDRRFLTVLALGFALLLFSHLPMALLVSLFLIGPYVLFISLRAAQPVRFLSRAFAAGALGIMLGAIFVLPALELLAQVSPLALSGSLYQPQNWFFWHVRAGTMSGRMWLIVPISIGAVLLATAAALDVRKRSRNREQLFWSILTILLVALIAGLVPLIWQLPGMKLVQFPWRALLLVEFATVTLIAITPLQSRNPLLLAGTGTVAFAYLVLAMIGGHMIGRTWSEGQRTAREIRSYYRDAPEYLPAGTPIHQGDGPDSAPIVLPDLALASAAEPRAKLTAQAAADGGLTMTLDSPARTSVLLRRFYFPHWQARDGNGRRVGIIEDPSRHVIGFRAPAGRSVFRLEVGTAPYERLGRALSSIALLLVAALASGELFLRRRKKHARSRVSAS